MPNLGVNQGPWLKPVQLQIAFRGMNVLRPLLPLEAKRRIANRRFYVVPTGRDRARGTLSPGFARGYSRFLPTGGSARLSPWLKAALLQAAFRGMNAPAPSGGQIRLRWGGRGGRARL